MASEQTFSTSDLRSASVDYKRETEHKQKWAHGQTWGPGRLETAHGRPVRRVSPLPQAIVLERQPGRIHAARMARKHNALGAEYASGDSSADEEVEEASAAPELDADITYSYDAAHGPGQGSQILGLALAKAVERFEDQATNKLVKEEYEVLNNEGESLPQSPFKKGKRASATEEDDYEFV